MEKVFIIGAARSGTKFIRDTIAASRDVCVVPYDVNYIWRYGNEDLTHDAISTSQCNESRCRYISSTIERFGRKNADGKTCRILVEKTVSNALRVPFVNAVFPEAKFVHLIRDGRDVIESAQRMWNSPRDYRYLVQKMRYFPFFNIRYGLWFAKQSLRFAGKKKGIGIWGPRYPGIEKDVSKSSILEVCAMQWKESVDAANLAFSTIQSSRVLTVKYEDLIADEQVIEKLCYFIGMRDIDTVIAKYRMTVLKGAKGKWRVRWTDDEFNAVLAIAGPTLERVGYL